MEEDDFVNISLKLYHANLHNYMFLVVVLPKLRRRTSFALLKNTIKVRYIIESAMIAYLDNCHGAIGK